MAGSIGGNSLCSDQHVILFQLCRMTESNFLSLNNSVEDRALSSRGYFVLLLVCILGFIHKFQENQKMARLYSLLELIKP